MRRNLRKQAPHQAGDEVYGREKPGLEKEEGFATSFRPGYFQGKKLSGRLLRLAWGKIISCTVVG